MTVEKTTRYVTSVDTLAEAWEFIMGRLDLVGDYPTISIQPIDLYYTVTFGEDGMQVVRKFEVLVEGMKEEE